MAHWHSLAKLRMHTDLSLNVLDSWTSVLGEMARTFVVLTCSKIETRELKSEYEARKRREARESAGKQPNQKGKGTKEGLSAANESGQPGGG